MSIEKMVREGRIHPFKATREEITEMFENMFNGVLKSKA